MFRRITVLFFAIFITAAAECQQSTFYLLLKAKALNETGKYDDVIELLSGAVEKSGDSRLFLERGEAYLKKNNHSMAVRDFQAANEIVPSSGEFSLSRAYALKGDAATSLYHLERHMRSAFKKSEKEILLDPAYILIENSSEWRQFLRKEWFSSIEKSLSEIEYYISNNSISDARTVLSRMEREYPGNEVNEYSRGLISLSEKNYSEAIKAALKLTAEYPDNERYLGLLAKAQFDSGNRAGSSLTYTTMLDKEVADARIYLKRAECYRKTGETGKAKSDAEAYLELYPEDKNAISLAGKLEAESGDNLKAISYFTRNIRLNPSDPGCYVDRANAYFVSSSWSNAINDYSMSLDLSPSDNEVWLNKGISLLNSGKKEDACHDFRKSFKLGNKKAAEYINRNCL
jgi:tetratricopeptide (TPR) repeat protein